MNDIIKPSANESVRFRELIRELGVPLQKLPDLISLSSEDCLAWWSERLNAKIDFSHIQRLTSLVGINENQLYLGSYDRELARTRLFGDQGALPERYELNKNSFLRTSAHIIRYITMTRGQGFTNTVLTRMNVSPAIYNDLSTKVNLTYFVDLLETLVKMGFSQDELDTLASVMFLSLQDTELGQRFSHSESNFDIYETLAKNFSYFDSNFEYHSEFVGKKYVLRTILPLRDHPYLQGRQDAVARLLRYRHILSAWFPYLAGMPPVFPKAELIRSTDAVEIRYEFDLKPTTTPLPKLRLMSNS